MTAPTVAPRLRVSWDPWSPDRPWCAHCPYCGLLGHSYSWDGAMWAAEQHAADPCPGLRLDALLARLREWLAALREPFAWTRRDIYAQGYEASRAAVADDLALIIREAAL